tara:strand:- start:65 stop:307 length:243 start_codon:yes stop_codon:yes gene_type:complete
MKKFKYAPRYMARVVGTDGSTFNINYPFVKNDVFLITDIRNNPIYLSPFKSEEKLDTRFKAKQKSLQFDFMALLDKKKDK